MAAPKMMKPRASVLTDEPEAIAAAKAKLDLVERVAELEAEVAMLTTALRQLQR